MARKVKSRELDAREARGRLKPGGKPYWKAVERGLHLGYRRLGKSKAGTWCVRHYLGKQRYEVEAIGVADDLSDADGTTILDYWQAQAKARVRMVERAKPNNGPLTVQDAVERYLDWLEDAAGAIYEARRRADAFIFPRLGDIECDGLNAEMVRNWHYQDCQDKGSAAYRGRRSAKICRLRQTRRRSRAPAARVGQPYFHDPESCTKSRLA